MDKCKQLTILISCLSSILTSALLLLQLQAVIVLKIAQQQSHLRHLQNEAILSRNNALARYRSVRKRFALFTFKKMCKIVFFTPAWDFTSAFLTGVKSDRLKISLRLERVNNIRNLCGDQSEFTSLHCGLLKWNHACNHPLSLDLIVNIWKRKERQRKNKIYTAIEDFRIKSRHGEALLRVQGFY